MINKPYKTRKDIEGVGEYGYLRLMWDIKQYGFITNNRTVTPASQLIGRQLRFPDVGFRFPLLTTKKVPFRLIAEELFWMIRGDTNVKSLQEKNVHIWDEWADKNGKLGPIYGKQWRRAGHLDNIDQLQIAIDTIKSNPNSRRIVVNSWQVDDIPDMALTPCHCMFQFHCDTNSRTLHMTMVQRSADIFLGVPFNIASYALLLIMVSHLTGYHPGDLIIQYGNVHLYSNHFEQAAAQIKRRPRKFPKLSIKSRGYRIDHINVFKYEDFVLECYDPHPAIKAPVAV